MRKLIGLLLLCAAVCYGQTTVTYGTVNATNLNTTNLVATNGTITGVSTSPNFNKKVTLDGTTNTTIQGTINAAAALGCAEAHIPAGNYIYDSTSGLSVPSCVSLTGDGMGKTNITFKNTAGSGAGYDLISNSSPIGGNNYIVVKDLSIDGSNLTTGTSRGIYFKNVSDFWVQYVGINGIITHGFFADDGSTRGWVQANKITNITVGTGVLLGNIPTAAVVSNIWATDNWISNTGANGVFSIGSKVAGQYGNFGIHADRNTCASGVQDTCVEIGASTQDSTANGNTVNITTNTGATGIGIRSTKNVTANGNTINCNSATGAVGLLIWSQGTDNTISENNTGNNNIIQNCPTSVKTTGSAAELDGITIQNNQYFNTTTAYSASGNETNLHYCNNSDNLCNINNGYTFDEGPIVASTIASQLKLQAVQGGQVGIVFRENDVALPNGLWRISINGDQILFNKNTAALGDFSTNFNFIRIGTGSAGTVFFDQGLVTAGAGLKVNTSVSNNGTGMQHKRVSSPCTTAASAGATCTTTVTWNTSFADANYTAVCNGAGPASGVPVTGGFSGRVAASINFITVAATAAAAQYSELDCIAMHD